MVRLILGQRQWRHCAGVHHRQSRAAQYDQDLLEHRVLAEARIDRLFQAAAEATQEAVLDALAAAETMTGRGGHRRMALRDVLK